TMSTGILQGRRASFLAAIGCTASILPHITAAIIGLTLLTQMNTAVFQWIKYLGAAYLIYFAWRIWQETAPLSMESQPDPKGNANIIAKGFMINVLNPKLTIFFLAFFPLFLVSNNQSAFTQMVLLGLIFMLLTLIIFIVYGLLASTVRQRIISSPKAVLWLQRAFALIFVGLAVRLALAA
ncbi:MAG: LysE family translocator, partial [Chloroflexota bacterium]